LIFNLKTIEESRERYRETLDLFFAACNTKVLKFRGQEIGLYNQPMQRPYPPLWFPSSNKESIEFTAKHGYHTAFLGSIANCKAHFEQYRETWARHRDDPGRHNAHVAEPHLAKTQHIVIADTESEAEKIGLQAYGSWAGHIHHLTRRAGRPDVHKTEPYAPDSAQPLLTGTPRVALEKLQELVRATGINYLLCIFSFGSLPPKTAMHSLGLFSREVMPRL
jgi:alkanesulfonate monooxygenase SsuD/methylene tetrahydromethanopterin reductase-like flavin-dependent oxidoreductase (luciferase family)